MGRFTQYGPGDSVTWGPNTLHPNDPRTPEAPAWVREIETEQVARYFDEGAGPSCETCRKCVVTAVSEDGYPDRFACGALENDEPDECPQFDELMERYWKSLEEDVT